jgi:hypothetical protein
MSHPGSRVARAIAAALLLAAMLGPLPPPAAASACGGETRASSGQDPRPHCCFTNARYVGTCEVEPAKDETCASIQEYLNNPQSQGKSYCGNTNIRGGWKSVPCEPKMKQD